MNMMEATRNLLLTGKDFRLLRRIHWVPRWVIFPSNRKQSVAEHSYGVACISLWLEKFHVYAFDIDFERDIMFLSIIHDRHEGITGDSPSPTKSRDPDRIKNMSQAEILVKVADCIEAYLWLQEEVLLGSTYYIQSIIDDLEERTYYYLKGFEWNEGMCGPKPTVIQLFEASKEFLRDEMGVGHPILEK